MACLEIIRYFHLYCLKFSVFSLYLQADKIHANPKAMTEEKLVFSLLLYVYDSQTKIHI